MRYLTQFLPRLWVNWITLLGSVITTLSAAAILVFLAVETTAPEHNRYTSTFLVLVLPFLFALGLVIIPIGLWVDRRQAKRRDPAVARNALEAAMDMAMRDRVSRRRILFVALATPVNIMIFAAAGHRTVSYMETPQFCGTTCHSVMQPEWEAYNRSPHSRVECVQCHIGPGASWAVKAKINGLHQVYAVLAKDYRRPIPTPVEHLRPSRDTCEQCHWPEKFTGNKVKLFPHFKDDKDNTPAFNAMLVRVGGQNPRSGKDEGIHWHVRANMAVNYQYLDARRQKIGKITVVEDGKTIAEFLPPGPPQKAVGERTMDCIDCHNRPTHIYDGTPHQAVDSAMNAGLLDQKVPFLAQLASEILAKPGAPRDGAEAAFGQALAQAYATKHPEVKPSVEQLGKAAATMARLYRRNVYPSMGIDWNTYRTNLGHMGGADNENVGCFRCHDGDHVATMPDGSKRELSQDCELCHETLAAEEKPEEFDDSLKAMLPRSE